MNQRSVSKLALSAAVAGMLAGATLLGACGGSQAKEASASAEKNSCKGPSGCGGKDEAKHDKNGCSSANGCNGTEKKGEANKCGGANGCKAQEAKKN